MRRGEMAMALGSKEELPPIVRNLSTTSGFLCPPVIRNEILFTGGSRPGIFS
jgi:hypothetical protein